MEIDQQTDDGILTISMDDGKMNALTIEAFETIRAAFDSAGDDVHAIVLTGREGVFTAGLDRKFLEDADRDGLHRLLSVFGHTLMRVWLEPRPVVAAATGHALAAGTMLSMAADHAIAAEGSYAWGLTETQINFQMPSFGICLAQHNVRNDRLEDLLLPGRKISPEEAVEAGFADELAPIGDVLDRAKKKAAELASLPAPAYAGTKRRLRSGSAERVLDNLDDDLRSLIDAALG